jgi:hypothetical protein
VDAGVDVCASAGTIPAIALTKRAISNFMTRSKLSAVSKDGINPLSRG